jgi:hypothetical protein
MKLRRSPLPEIAPQRRFNFFAAFFSEFGTIVKKKSPDSEHFCHSYCSRQVQSNANRSAPWGQIPIRKRVQAK